MKQAILITAYKDAKNICDIVNYLGEEFEFYIHIDKKSRLDLSEITGKKYTNVHVFQKYNVYWGSVNHLKSILFLSNKAIQDKRNVFFHLITGQDLPIKTKDFFISSLDITKDYLEYFEVPSPSWEGNGGMDRFRYYLPYEIFNYRNVIGRKIITALKTIQKTLRIDRTPCNIFHQLYGGSTYWSLTRNSLQYVLEFTKKNTIFLKKMNYTFCSEEVYFQTILLNSHCAKNVVNDNLRYTDWTTGRGGYPAFLDETDFVEIKKSNKLFARKFNEKYSTGVKELIRTLIHRH